MKRVFTLIFLLQCILLFPDDNFEKLIFRFSTDSTSLNIYATEESRNKTYNYMGKIKIDVLKNKISVSQISARFQSSNYPCFQDDNYFVFTFRMDDRFRNLLFVLDLNTATYQIIETNTMYIADIFIYQNKLYYSTEKNDFTIAKVDLESGEITFFENEYVPNADFFNFNGNVYAVSDYTDTESVFLIDDNLIRVPRNNVEIVNRSAGQLNLLLEE